MSMTQFNLLPDVKLKFIKAQRTKRLVISVAVLVTAAALAILIIIIGLILWQKKSLGDLNGDISRYSAQVKGIQDLNQILTIQNQLNSLPGLYNQKPDATRLSSYLAELTPSAVNFSSVDLDFTKNTIDITGTAKDLATVDQFVDTLKFAQYATSGSNCQQANNCPLAFSNVVLTSFGVDPTQSQNAPNSGASYTIDSNFNPAIFASGNGASLVIKSQITTRSNVDQPNNLFTGNNKGN